MKSIRNQRGAVSSTIIMAIVLAVVIVLVLFFVLRDQGKDDKPNNVGVNGPQVVMRG